MTFVCKLAFISFLTISLFKNADANEDAEKSAIQSQKFPTASTILLSVQMGHHSQQQIVFKSSPFEGSTIYVISYIHNGRSVGSRVVPHESFDLLRDQFAESVPESVRARLSSAFTCGEPLTIARGAGKVWKTEMLCLDGAMKSERDAITGWWKNIRSTIRI
jgi:hypothetical protein